MTDAADVTSVPSDPAAKLVIVVGGGVAGLVAALECAKVGMRVTVLERDTRVGGVIRREEVGGVAVDLAADGFSTRGGVVAAVLDQVGLGDAVIRPEHGGRFIAGATGVAPLPAETVFGIPANAWAEDVRRHIGWSGAWRAYLDRLRPPLTIGQEQSLGRLVRTRMGDRVRDRLVAPLSVGGYAVDPDDVLVDEVAPGLNAALTRTGSLAGAVAAVRAERDGGEDGLAGLSGGMARIIDGLVARLFDFGVEIRTQVPVTGIRRTGDAGGRPWLVQTDDEAIAADAVVVAVDEDGARAVLAHAAPQLASLAVDVAPTVPRESITLVFDAPGGAVDRPGPVVHAVPGTRRASTLLHQTGRWNHLRAAAGESGVVARVTFGGPGDPPATAALDDAAAATMALAEASALLALPLDGVRLRGTHRYRYDQPPPASARGRAERAARARAALTAAPGIALVGAWLAGTGLAQVVDDAIDQADALRRGVLFGGVAG
ncbi:oxygen-dependent protoporphyrinogen oxidase [Microbacterium sp. AK009]|uniref:protoporphyrinogen/coproporphyrinogen oxidase n=1 Tax=Microbacterium sp. AK009 TaxID=2723068 RepID=UPI00183F4BB8|nr:FAD-dependent oxidoreductase [Microbacterium sp. AK009]NYF15268.1 oxygen-dependent protoporphyrinogen oxidase [Microbacterium sp. AK009]